MQMMLLALCLWSSRPQYHHSLGEKEKDPHLCTMFVFMWLMCGKMLNYT